eukprot:1234176-Rhodomonas_salina.1
MEGQWPSCHLVVESSFRDPCGRRAEDSEAEHAAEGSWPRADHDVTHHETALVFDRPSVIKAIRPCISTSTGARLKRDVPAVGRTLSRSFQDFAGF